MAKAAAWAKAGVLTRTRKSPSRRCRSWEYFFFHIRLLHPSAILITYIRGRAKFDHDTEGEKRKRETETHEFTIGEATKMMCGPDWKANYRCLILSTIFA